MRVTKEGHGQKIECIKGVAYSIGLLSREELNEFVDKYQKSGQVKYVRRIK